MWNNLSVLSVLTASLLSSIITALIAFSSFVSLNGILWMNSISFLSVHALGIHAFHLSLYYAEDMKREFLIRVIFSTRFSVQNWVTFCAHLMCFDKIPISFPQAKKDTIWSLYCMVCKMHKYHHPGFRDSLAILLLLPFFSSLRFSVFSFLSLHLLFFLFSAEEHLHHIKGSVKGRFRLPNFKALFLPLLLRIRRTESHPFNMTSGKRGKEPHFRLYGQYWIVFHYRCLIVVLYMLRFFFLRSVKSCLSCSIIGNFPFGVDRSSIHLLWI